jgi:hypothetical protein
MARKDAVGNTRAMTSSRSPTRHHRWLRWHAPAIRRTVIVGAIGLIVAVALLWFMPSGIAVVAGWDPAALAFLMSVWPIIIRADSSTPRSWQNPPTRSKLLAVPRAPTAVPVAAPGVMMGLEINTLAMQGLSWQRPQVPLGGDAAPEGRRWAPGLAG